MKISLAVVCFYSITGTVSAATLPDVSSVSTRNTPEDTVHEYPQTLVRRKGGGGGGGKGGGSSSSSSGGSSGSSARTGATSNAGGATSAGSGTRPTYGGGKYYGGGATTPYAAGGVSPRGISPLYIAAPLLLLGAGSLWAYGAYSYPYANPYSFRNVSRSNSTNESIPVQCWCQQYQVCGCDDNDDRAYLDSVVGNGTGLNDTLARVSTVNSTDTLIINGTLPNGTTASGGTDDATTSGAVKLQGSGQWSGWWMMLASVGSIVYYC